MSTRVRLLGFLICGMQVHQARCSLMQKKAVPIFKGLRSGFLSAGYSRAVVLYTPTHVYFICCNNVFII